MKIIIGERVRGWLSGTGLFQNPQGSHGYGAVGVNLAATIKNTSSRTHVELGCEELEVLTELVLSMMDAAWDDAKWDIEAQRDLRAARRLYRKLVQR